jgi:hypothetical protein
LPVNMGVLVVEKKNHDKGYWQSLYYNNKKGVPTNSVTRGTDTIFAILNHFFLCWWIQKNINNFVFKTSNFVPSSNFHSLFPNFNSLSNHVYFIDGTYFSKKKNTSTSKY